MPRLLFALLALIFTLESSGAALASTTAPSNVPSLKAELASAFVPLVGAFEANGMLMTAAGRAATYEQLTALKTRAKRRAWHANPNLHEPHALPVLRQGVLIKLPLPDRVPPNASKSAAAPIQVQPQRTHAAAMLGTAAITASTANTTGAPPWWSFASGSIRGGQAYSVNVANGNLMVAAQDVYVSERGIPLEFTRYYNSRSAHDYQNTDASTASIFGQGWTSNYDVHIAYNSGLNSACPSTQGISVYAQDGARYDYKPDCNGNFIAPPGMQGTVLAYTNNCRYTWTLKDGTMYDMWMPDFNTCFSTNINAAYSGRLYRVYGANRNNYVELDYSWANNDTNDITSLTQINVAHSLGQQLILSFGLVNGQTELTSIKLPDGNVLSYSYDSGNRLAEVDKPGNGSDSNAPLAQKYGYWSGTPYRLNWASSPNWNASNGAAGSYTWFDYTSATSDQIQGVQLYGWGNFMPNDGTSTALQPSLPVQSQELVYSTFTYYSWGLNVSDTNGHSTNWLTDSLGRVTQTQVNPNDPNGSELSTSQGWDAENDLISQTDPRGNETDIAYDASGNAIAVAEPAVATSEGTFRPTTLYSYASGAPSDVTAICDAVFTHSLGLDWQSPPAVNDNLCPSQTGATRYGWALGDPTQPYGRITDIYSPLGDHKVIAYNTPMGDVGLPSSVTDLGLSGNGISQLDGTTRLPKEQFLYDTFGNVACYSNFTESSGATHWSRIVYDTMNRPTEAADPDDSSLSVSSCSNTPGISQSRIVSTATYNPDGSVATSSAPVQNGIYSTSYNYDADGNVVQITDNGNTTGNGTVVGITKKWYDGADRLVEVLLPFDSTMNQWSGVSHPDPTRYLYDLTQNGASGTNQIGNVTVTAHGAMFKTQMCIAPQTTTGSAPCSWSDTRGASYDALGRTTNDYTFLPGASDLTAPTIETTSFTYDANTYAGLLTQKVDADGDQTNLTYDNLGEVTGVAFASSSSASRPSEPSRTYNYDPDGRVASITSSVYGMESFTYNSDGDLIRKQEANGGGITGAGLIGYDYYADGTRKDIQILAGPSQLVGRTLFQYAYRNDGLPQWLKFDGNTQPFAWTYTSAGRETSQSDPTTGTSAPNGALVARSISYHVGTYGIPNGEPQQVTMPNGGLYGSLTYNPDGLLTSYVASLPNASGTSPTAFSFAYDARHEMIGSGAATGTAPPSPAAQQYSYYGVLTNQESTVDPRAGAYTEQWDPKAITCPSGGGWDTIQYDADGRDMGLQATCGSTVTPVESFSYDQENHTTFEGCSVTTSVLCSATQNTYGWGPSGQMVQMTQGTPGGASSTYSLHWDGSQLLYVTDASGNLVQLNLGQLATWTEPTGQITVFDRDLGATQVSMHQAGATGQWISGYGSASATYPGEGTFNGATSNGSRFLVNGQVLGSNRSDGYDDKNLSFQGVRAYSRAAMQWSTPDMFPGYADDPMTQRRYMWNDNNGMSNIDPTGFCSVTVWGAGGPRTAQCPTDGAVDPTFGVNPGGFGGGPTTRGNVCGKKGFGGGILIGVSGIAEAGVPGAAGASGTGSVAAGAFYGYGNGFSVGDAASGGATAYAGSNNLSAPSQDGQPGVALASAGAGLSITFTNARSVQQLSGPFQTYSLNIGVGPAQFSAQVAYSNGIWTVSIGPPGVGVSIGASVSRMTTTTATTPVGCK